MFGFCLCVLVFCLQHVQAQPLSSSEVPAWIEHCDIAQSSFKWTDLGYPWLGINWGYKSVDTARTEQLPTDCVQPQAQALRLLSDAVVLLERELAQGQGPTLDAFYRYWGCAEEPMRRHISAARTALPAQLTTRPDPAEFRTDWLLWAWHLLTESTPWQCG